MDNEEIREEQKERKREILAMDNEEICKEKKERKQMTGK